MLNTWSFSHSGNCVLKDLTLKRTWTFSYLSLKGIDKSFNSNFDKVL